MEKLIPVLLLVPLVLWVSCGNKDQGPVGPPGPQTKRVVADTTVDAPTLASPDEFMWGSVDSVTVPVLQSNQPKIYAPKTASVPSEVQVQAINKAGQLYLRLKWSDPDVDSFRDHFKVDSIKDFSPLPLVEFTNEVLPPAYEDQAFVLFAGFGANGYDVWNWRVLTTGSARLAEGYTLTSGLLDSDAVGSAGGAPAIANPASFKQPVYIHKDTSDFTGYVLYTTDTLNLNDTLYSIYDPFLHDSMPVQGFNTTGWTLGQKVPGWLIDSSFASLTAAERGSRWDIRAVSVYDSSGTSNQYRVVLSCPLNTGYNDDIDLSVKDSVQVKIGLFDDQIDFGTASSNRGFSDEFCLILK